MDCRVRIAELCLSAHVGCFEQEKQSPQKIKINIEFVINAALAAQTDYLSDVINYDQVADLVRRRVAELSWNLIEKMSADLAQEILAAYPTMKSVSVEVKKDVIADSAGVSALVKLRNTRR